MADGEALFAFMVVCPVIVFTILIYITIITIIETWKIFTKGNQPGWASLIPIYSQYTLCKMVGVNPWWILIGACSVFLSFILSFIPVVGLLLGAFSIYFSVLLNVSLARAFEYKNSFAIGLILLPPIFYGVLAFGKDEYKGANPMEDIVMNKINGAKNTNTNVNQNVNSTPGTMTTQNNNIENLNQQTNTNSKFCTNCGAQIPEGSRFCTSCGTEVK